MANVRQVVAYYKFSQHEIHCKRENIIDYSLLDEGYYRNTLCALILISTFLLHKTRSCLIKVVAYSGLTVYVSTLQSSFVLL